MFEKRKQDTYYKIENLADMPPFFINVATASDVWMYLSSSGALAAGRGNPAGSVFPYETDDRLHLATSTGPKTIIRLSSGQVWQPFSTVYDSHYNISRNIYKRNTGDAVIFEEINTTLGMKFEYKWETGEKYGLIRTSKIFNTSKDKLIIDVLDGVENIMPYDISLGLAQGSSCLTDAYKACEAMGNRLAVYSLTSLIGDTPEPIEVLQANVAWHVSEAEGFLLSSKQIRDFARTGIQAMAHETNSVGRKGAFLGFQRITLANGATKDWMLVLDARKTQSEVIALAKEVNESSTQELRKNLEADISKNTAELTRIVAAADGMQRTNSTRASLRHYMNVLYNNMRGGVFLNEYELNPSLFIDFVKVRNKQLMDSPFMAKVPTIHNTLELHAAAFATGDKDIIRLALEFLPLTFSRRHGDPSRPWNYFNVKVKDDQGNRVYAYEGNWRDIFQNWEAMGLSYPSYIAPMIAKFLNASTADGFNPYRINQDGIDWEVPTQENPFSGYGYWGDHQIVYLNKLLEWLEAYSPKDLKKLMTSEVFAYANIPYEIVPYREMLKNAKDTIIFNQKKHDALMAKAETVGTDAKLIAVNDQVYHVSFMEKLLVPILAKLSNLVPKGGIWMNTQRPEWNDANNAIVGNGLSMVTVYQLYRHLNHIKKITAAANATNINGFDISVEVATWLSTLEEVLIASGISPRVFLDKAAATFDDYRAALYKFGFSGKKARLSHGEILTFIDNAITVITDTIEANRRNDGMYHAYNILTLSKDSLKVDNMFLMLEGQTAILASGLLDTTKAIKLINAMESSPLMSPEHDQFFLYPKKILKTFAERNIIPVETVENNPVIKDLADKDNGLFTTDISGAIRFHHNIRHSSHVENAITVLALSDADAQLVREVFEDVFQHRQFTGRSGIMYKYEGIGSIYWHQNSKFMLSVQEVFMKAATQGDLSQTTSNLKRAYYRLFKGFGFNKDASKWGAFPLEPYSHTPYGMPAQQPGMTGMVKEDILTRMAELGVVVAGGSVTFDPVLLQRSEFLMFDEKFPYIAAYGEAREITIPNNSLVFTLCRVPVVYTLEEEEGIEVNTITGQRVQLALTDGKLCLGAEYSQHLFESTGAIISIHVKLSESRILQ